jgi:hypothetical protein
MMATVMTSQSERGGVSHLEGMPANMDEITKVDGYDGNGLVKSTFDQLSILQTLWAFKRVILISLAVYTGYVCEGFEVSNNNPLLPTPWEAVERVVDAMTGSWAYAANYSSVLEAVSSPTLASSNSSVKKVTQASGHLILLGVSRIEYPMD